MYGKKPPPNYIPKGEEKAHTEYRKVQKKKRAVKKTATGPTSYYTHKKYSKRGASQARETYGSN